jgi:hypothetical protein
MAIWQRVLGWFEGKKTILGGAVILAGAVAAVWLGKVDPATGLTLAGVGLSIVGYGDKANRHQAELLTALQGVAQVGADIRAGNKQQAVKDAETTAEALAPAVIGEAAALGGASLHISGNTADEVASLAKSLLTPAAPVFAVSGGVPVVAPLTVGVGANPFTGDSTYQGVASK